jgi:UDP-N-acetylmuramoylalanine--D-glutamate ligase
MQSQPQRRKSAEESQRGTDCLFPSVVLATLRLCGEDFLLMLDLKGKRVLVLGLGDTGLSMVRWLVRRGADVHVADSRDDPPHAGTLTHELPQVRVSRGAFRDSDFVRADMIAVSPGIDLRRSPVADAVGRGIPVVGDIELFAQTLAAMAARPRLIAITGSNGKSTVTAMVGDMGRTAGMATAVAGNIGLPALDALTALESGGPLPDLFVLELSSFQLESTSSLRPDAAAMLNLCEDHMDRYRDLDEYAAAKERIFAGDGAQVLNRDDRWSMCMARPHRCVVTFGLGAPRSDEEWGIAAGRGKQVLANGAHELLAVDELPVTGLHNAGNALAALALARAIDLPEPPLVAALRAFKGLPHRVQKVAEIGEVAFYDDSKGTNVGATVAALSGMSRPIVLIAGGDGKGQDFMPLVSAVSARAREVVLIGQDADAITRVLSGCAVPITRARSMQEAVEAAYAASRPGDAILLSPACASYDMFRNYVHRAEVFFAAVQNLVKRDG